MVDADRAVQQFRDPRVYPAPTPTPPGGALEIY